MTDKEFDDYLNTLIESLKNADNYAELYSAYKKVGLTIDELYRGNEMYYKDNYIIDKLYNQWVENRLPGEKKVLESEMKEIDGKWQVFISTVVKEYKRSRSYKTLQPILTSSQKEYLKGTGENIKASKKGRYFS